MATSIQNMIDQLANPVRVIRSEHNEVSCPGLNRSNDRRMTWYIPVGETSATCTYCMECVTKDKIPNCYPSTTNITDCNCDSFLLHNHIGDDLISISLWDTSLKHDFRTNENGDVEIPNGSKYAILIYSRSDQYFSAKIAINGKELAISQLQDMFHENSLLVQHDDTKKKFQFGANTCLSDETWKLVEASSCSKLDIELMLYDKKKIDLNTMTNTNVGHYKYTDDGDIIVSPSDHCPKLSSGYSVSEQLRYSCLPHKKFVPFLKVPLKFSINIVPPKNEKNDMACLNFFKSNIAQISNSLNGNIRTMSAQIKSQEHTLNTLANKQAVNKGMLSEFESQKENLAAGVLESHKLLKRIKENELAAKQMILDKMDQHTVPENTDSTEPSSEPTVGHSSPTEQFSDVFAGLLELAAGVLELEPETEDSSEYSSDFNDSNEYDQLD